MLTQLLANTSRNVLQGAAENIALLCFYSAGKRAAVANPETTQQLITLMSHEDTQVRIAVSAALMGITVDNAGKVLPLCPTPAGDVLGMCKPLVREMRLKSVDTDRSTPGAS